MDIEAPLTDLQYPIGRPVLPTAPLTAAERTEYINQLAALPAQLTAAARKAGGVRLENPYCPGGWTGRQVIHHVADVHLNFYLRYRLALTEDHPTIRPFDMNASATLPDNAAVPITVSLALLEALHSRWVTLLWHLTEEQWQRTFYHPLYNQIFTLDQALVQYSWHGRHHQAHIELLSRQAWCRAGGASGTCKCHLLSRSAIRSRAAGLASHRYPGPPAASPARHM